ATNTPISMSDLLTILLISLVTSKGAHGVPGSAIVVLAATLQAIPAIPAIGLVLVLSVDWFMGIARALGNLVGNCVATVAVAAWEGDIDRERAHAVLDGRPVPVTEALMQLQARGFVEVRSRKGWYVVEPSIDEARDAFAARRALEAGMLRQTEGRPLQAVVRRLPHHVAEESRAVEGADAANRAFLLADFH